MDYKRIYDEIIKNAKDRDCLLGYYENHHIIPKSLGGSDKKDNIAKLTAREHFICHVLLSKIYSTGTIEYYKMVNALIMMKCNSKTHNRYFNSYLYQKARKRFAENQSINQQGIKNSQSGKVWVFNRELEKSKSIPQAELDSYLSAGWKRGRVVNPTKYKKIDKACTKCGCCICERPDICSKRQMVNTLIKFFGLDRSVVGTPHFYDEYDRVVSMIEEEYNINMKSTCDISIQYGVSTQRLDSIFKSIGISHRNMREATLNYNNKQLKKS